MEIFILKEVWVDIFLFSSQWCITEILRPRMEKKEVTSRVSEGTEIRGYEERGLYFPLREIVYRDTT